MILALRKLVYSSAMITGIRTSLAGALCLLPLVFLPSIAIAQASPSRGAAIIDSMPNAKRIEQAVVSPDGTRVAYIVHATLTVAPVDGAPAKTIEVEGKLPLRGVSWSNDSKQLVFIADLPDEVPSAQVWTVSADGGSPTKRAELKGNVDAASFSPDGSKIALLFIEGMPRAAGPLQPMTPLSGVVGDKIYEQRLATIDLGTNALTQLTPADVYVYEYDWTPDGQGWVATAAHGSGDANWYVARLYRIDSRSGEMREIYAPKLQIAGPRVSPDGKNVAFIEGLMSDEGVTGGDIFVVPIAGGSARNITPKIKSSPSSLAWSSPDQILFTENIDGQSAFGAVSANGGSIRTLWTGDEFIGTSASPTSSFSRDGSVTAHVGQSGSTPPEVWAGAIGKWKQMTSINSDIKPAWGQLHNFHWTNGNTHLEGWLMQPKDFDASKKYPLVVNVHGGPSSACSARWDAANHGGRICNGILRFVPESARQLRARRSLHARQREGFRGRRLSRHHGCD